MPRDDYTGKAPDDLAGLFEPTDEELLSLDRWLDADDDLDDDGYDMPNEVIIRATYAIDGVTTLQQAAERLYDYADELSSMAASGWELIDAISDGQGVAIMLDEYGDSDD